MKKVLTDAIKGNRWFYALSAFACFLLLASFIVPPMGIIDKSVLAGVGEISALGAIGAVLKAIDKGIDASVTHNNTTLTVSGSDDEQEK